MLHWPRMPLLIDFGGYSWPGSESWMVKLSEYWLVTKWLGLRRSHRRGREELKVTYLTTPAVLFTGLKSTSQEAITKGSGFHLNMSSLHISNTGLADAESG